jgi:cyclopropane fatty-acyl-phospholipid synthase-like methyltransferase
MVVKMSFLQKILFTYWYFRDPPWDTNQTPPEVLEFIEQNPPGKALDLGCGTGTNAITLAKNEWQVTGVDFVGKAIRTAKRKAQQAGVAVDFRVGDVTKLSGISGPFDLILDIGCYHSLSQSGKLDYAQNIFRLLKKGGSCLFYAFFRQGDSDTETGVSEADLEIFSAQLELVSRVDGFERETRPSVWLTFQNRGTRS